MRGSIIRAVVFALVWAVCPFWLFLLVALYLFFVPFSQIKIVIIPFLALLILTALQPTGFFAAVILGAIFWCTLLIKELYLVDRKSAYEALTLTLTYLLVRDFYLKAGDNFGGTAIVFALIIAFVISALFSTFIKNFTERDALPEREPKPAESGNRSLLRKTTVFLVFFLVFEFLMTGLFLPLDFIYQSSIVFLLAALVMEFFGKHLFNGNLLRERVLAVSSSIFVLLVIILGSARWGL